MYIHPFWCGVAATLIVETIALICATVWASRKAKKQSVKRCGECNDMMYDSCETCLRWYECNGVDRDICPLTKESDADELEI